uniref:Uncharacterized protein n=1 Tax=Mycena chlorophos TaxID=658473 RepID=A0ABQ0LAY0_MYCCL|nr:predicted protein [Mycena chlorophos]
MDRRIRPRSSFGHTTSSSGWGRRGCSPRNRRVLRTGTNTRKLWRQTMYVLVLVFNLLMNRPGLRRMRNLEMPVDKAARASKPAVDRRRMGPSVSQMLRQMNVPSSSGYYRKFSKANISKLPPLHPNRRCAPLPPPPMISRSRPKTEKEEEEEEEWEDSLIRDVGGWETWKCLGEEKQNAARSAKRRREEGLDE